MSFLNKTPLVVHCKKYVFSECCSFIKFYMKLGMGCFIIIFLQTLKELKLDVTDAVVFLDREQGGTSNLSKMGIDIVSVVTITQVGSRLISN